MQVAIERAVQLHVLICVEAVGTKVHLPNTLRTHQASKVVLNMKLEARIVFPSDIAVRSQQQWYQTLNGRLKVSVGVHNHVSTQSQDSVGEYGYFRRGDNSDSSIRAQKTCMHCFADLHLWDRFADKCQIRKLCGMSRQESYSDLRCIRQSQTPRTIHATTSYPGRCVLQITWFFLSVR